jgi:hypothetical protein
MKPLIIAAAAILPIAAAGLAGCAPIADTSYSSKVSNSRDFTRVGEVMLHVDVLENLPDCPGRACLPEKAKNLVYSELVYVGLNGAMQPIFRRRDSDILIEEMPPHRGVIQRFPEAKGQFTLDYSKGRLITMLDRTVEIIEATPAGVTFTVRHTPAAVTFTAQ